MASKAHFGGKYIDAGCVDGLRIPCLSDALDQNLDLGGQAAHWSDTSTTGTQKSRCAAAQI